MEPSRPLLGFAVLAAIIIGAGIAWWQRPEPAAIKEQAPIKAGAPDPGTKTAPVPRQIYKWQDDAGVFNFTDRPPPDRPYSLVTETPNVTVLPSIVPESADSGTNSPDETPRD